MSDLIFAGKKQVVILNGNADFIRISSGNKHIEIYMHGNLIGCDKQVVSHRTHFEDLFGQFVVLIHDLQHNNLSINNDRYGLIPFYQVSTPDKIYFSIRIKSFIDREIVESKLDHSALSDLLAFSVPLDTKTPVRNVYTIEAGSIVNIELDSLRTRAQKLWDPAAILQEKRYSFLEVKEELFSLFLEGYKKCIHHTDKVGITLSGGIDSRCLLSVGLYIGQPLDTYVTGVPGSRGEQYARRMAEMCHLPYYFHPLGKEFGRNYYHLLQSVMHLTEGMSFSSETEGHWLRDHASKHQVMLHGAFAELSKIGLLHNFFLDRKILKAKKSSLADLLWKRFEPRFCQTLEGFSGEFRKQISQQAKMNLKNKISDIDNRLNTAEIVQMLYIEEYLQKVTKYSSYIWNDRVPTYFPFSYPQYVDMILRLRTQDKMRQKTQMYLLKRTSPQLLRFPDANTGTRVGTPVFLNKIIHVANWAAKKLFGSNVLYDHMNFVGWMNYMEPAPEEILLNSSEPRIYNKKNIKKLIQKIRRGDNEAAIILQSFLRFELWRKYIGLDGI